MLATLAIVRSARSSTLGVRPTYPSCDGELVIEKIADIKALLLEGRRNPSAVLPHLRALAASTSWQEREVAATGLVELAKRHPDVVLSTAATWARDRDPNIRRAGSEGLRGLVQ